ncbi:hemerythrin domain-containing protein [Planosporangium sp. 12N6]|uniref:hemerythrin domain-containing protein n=1 Tax=Planosporangium spinosum TaxID=3402278 RepID=UPI003CF9DA87
MFNPLEYNGIPLERQTRDWRELDVSPIDPEATDPYATCRIIAVNGVENEAIQFDFQIARNHADSDVRREMDYLASLSEQQHRVVHRLLPDVGSVLETALEYEHAAVDLDSWLARMEPDPQRREVYECDALEDFDHLYRYTDVLEMLRHRRADRVVDELTDVLPERAAAGQAPLRGEGGQEPTTAPLSELNALTMLSVEQELSQFYRSARPGHVDPVTRPTYQEIGRVEEEQVARHQVLVDPSASWWEQLVIHEYNECYLYYSFLQQETDPRVRAVWELYLDMQLARLQLARDLLRRFEDRDADEVVGSGLPEPLGFERNREFLRQLLAARLGRGSLGAEPVRDVPEVREVRDRLENVPPAEGAPDLIDVLTEQHRRIEALFEEVEVATGERRRAAWEQLVELLSVHEAAEGEVVHPLARDRIVGGFDVARDLVEEERTIRQLLLRLADGGIEDEGFESGVTELREAVRAHARNEERFEYPQLRDRLPAGELRELAAAVRPTVPA